MKITKRIVSLFLVSILILSFSGCDIKIGKGGKDDEQEISKLELLETSELLYPKTNKTFRYNVYTDYTEITEYLNKNPESNENIVIPDELPDEDGNMLPVLAIANNAFEEGGLASLKLGKNIVKIDEYAFAGCAYLTSVELNDSIEILGESCFQECIRLGKIQIPNSVSIIPENCFYQCVSLTSVTIEDGKNDVVIDSYAFEKCENLKNIWIPNNVSSIESSAFDYGFGDFTIYGYSKSAAAIFAADNRLDFVVLDKKDFDKIVKETKDVEDPIVLVDSELDKIVETFNNNPEDYDALLDNVGSTLKEMAEKNIIDTNYNVNINENTENSENSSKIIVVDYSAFDFGEHTYEATIK